MLTIPVSLTLGGTDQSISQLVRERDAGTFALDVTVTTDLTDKTLTAYIRRPDNQVIEDLDNFNVTDFVGGKFTYTPPDNAFWYKGNAEIDFLITELDNDTITTPKVLFEIVKPVDKNRTIPGEDTPVINQDLMRKTVYDTNNNGVVDNSESLGGSPAADYMLIAVYEPEIDDNTNYRLIGHIPVSEKAQPNGVATLNVDGKIETAQLPALVIIDTYPVNSEVEQLALDVQKGDVAVRLDQSKSYINVTGNNATISDWQELLSPTDAVQSVNGKIGTVVLTTADITESGNLYYTEDRVTNNTTVQSLVTPTRSTEQTSNESAFSYPVETKRGMLKKIDEGRAIFNLADNGVDYGNWVVAGTGTTKGAEGIHLEQDGGTDKAELPTNLKENTQYTLIYNIKAKTGTGTFEYFANGFDSAFSGGNILISSLNLGIFEVVTTTKSTITTNRIYSIIATDGSVDFELLAIIEGDATSENITEELSYGYNFASAEITETSTDGTNTDTRTLDYKANYPDGKIKELHGILDTSESRKISEYLNLPTAMPWSVSTPWDGINTVVSVPSTNISSDLKDGVELKIPTDNGVFSSDIPAGSFRAVTLSGVLYARIPAELTSQLEIQNYFDTANSKIFFELETPILVTTPQKPLATFESGSYSATLPSGLHPVKKYTTPTNRAATIEDTHQYQVELGTWVESKLP